MSLWIADAGPLIFLTKLDRLDLLKTAGYDIRIPTGVMSEIRAKADEACMQLERASKTWLQIQAISNQEAVDLLRADLDIGEAEVITLAKEIHADKVLLDDLDARRFARRVGLSSIGTVGVLLAARLRGEIPSLRDEIERLQVHGFWMSEVLTEEVLKVAGE